MKRWRLIYRLGVSVFAIGGLAWLLVADWTAGACAISVLIYVVGIVWLWRQLRPPTGECPACGYDLRGTPSGPCPECGAAREAKAT